MLDEIQSEQKGVEKQYRTLPDSEQELRDGLKHERLDGARKLAETKKGLTEMARKNDKLQNLLGKSMKLTA